MRITTAITIVLFSIGGISAILISHNYFTNVHVISKQQAIALAIKFCQWSPEELENYTIEAKLLQAKFSNRVALVLNDTTMLFEPFAVPLRTGYVKNDQLFWEVIIKKQVGNDGFKEWIYEIDAINGTRIESITPNG